MEFNYKTRKLGKIKCETCKKECVKTATGQRFCIKCGIKNEKKVKEKWRKKQIKKETLPQFYCSHCGQLIQLDFEPIKEGLRWLQFKCPFCNKKQN